MKHLEARPPKRRKHHRHLETITCGLRGHVTPAATVTRLRGESDAGLGVESDFYRFARCIRCDAWTSQVPPISSPTSEVVPDYESIELPRRGEALREAVVMRAIAVNKGIHATAFGLLGIVLTLIEFKLGPLKRWAQNVLDRLTKPLSDTGQDPSRDFLVRQFNKILGLHKGGLKVLLFTALLYCVVEAIEAVGLWREKRWAEYLTVLATAGFIPFELHELLKRVTVIRVGALVINIALIVWLIAKKRLFGLPPRHDAEMIDRAALLGPPAHLFGAEAGE